MGFERARQAERTRCARVRQSHEVNINGFERVSSFTFPASLLFRYHYALPGIGLSGRVPRIDADWFCGSEGRPAPPSDGGGQRGEIVRMQVSAVLPLLHLSPSPVTGLTTMGSPRRGRQSSSASTNSARRASTPLPPRPRPRPRLRLPLPPPSLPPAPTTSRTSRSATTHTT